MNLSDFSFSTLGEYSCDLQSFDCGREDINEFFRACRQKGEITYMGKEACCIFGDSDLIFPSMN